HDEMTRTVLRHFETRRGMSAIVSNPSAPLLELIRGEQLCRAIWHERRITCCSKTICHGPPHRFGDHVHIIGRGLPHCSKFSARVEPQCFEEHHPPCRRHRHRLYFIPLPTST